MATPLLSIGLPLYNGEKYLARALDCLLGQDFTDFELIISDNASGDGSPEICRKYARQDSRIRYERCPANIGAVPNHNRVVELARGMYFKWAAHDDECYPGMLLSCMEEFRSNSVPVALAYTQAELIDDDGRSVEKYAISIDAREAYPHQRLAKIVASAQLGIPMYGICPLDVLRRTRPLQSFISVDHVLFAELAMMGEIREVPQPLLRKRMHAQRATHLHSSPKEWAKWSDPNRKHRFLFVKPSDRVLFEYFRSIWHVHIGFREKIRCMRSVLANHPPLHYRIARWKARVWGRLRRATGAGMQ